MTPSSQTQPKSSPSACPNLARVRVYWGETLYDTRIVPADSTVTVGKSASNTFILDFDSGVLGESWELLRVYPHRAELLYRTKTQGKASLGKARYPFHELAEKNLAVQERSGVYRLQLTEQDAADIELSDLRFKIDWVAEAPKVPKARSLQDKGARTWNAVLTAFVTLAVLAVAYFDKTWKSPPAPEKNTRTVALLPRLAPVPAPVVEPIPIATQPEPIVEKEAPAPVAPTKKPVRKPTVHAAPAPPPPAPTPQDELADLGSMVKGLSAIGTKPGNPPKRKSPTRGSALALPGLGASSEALPNRIEAENVGSTEGQGSGKFKMTRTQRQPDAVSSEGAAALAREVVDDLIRRREAKIRRCYEKELARTPSLQGGFVARFTILASGGVGKVQILEDTLKSGATSSCVAKELQSLQFPASGAKNTFEYPFVFEPTVR